MTYYDAYIGKLEDPSFSWGGDGVEGSPPRRISPFFPPTPGGGMMDSAFWRVIRWIDDGRLEGKQVDWGAWVAKATKEDLERFIDSLYAHHEWYSSGSPMPHLLESFKELEAFVENLEPGKDYALVASEL